MSEDKCLLRCQRENTNLKYKLDKERTHHRYDVKVLKEKIEKQKFALRKMQEENRSLKEDLQNAKSIMDQAHERLEENLELRAEIEKLKNRFVIQEKKL